MSDQKSQNSGFEKPRHWMALEELTPEYWTNAAEEEKRGQEFLEKPIESLAKLENSEKFAVDRREFLTLMGAGMALASASCARRPVNKIIPYVVRPEEIQPGVAYSYASTCRECETGCGIVTKNREGRPVKLEGNAQHPVNSGSLCARGQASVLDLYDPDRLKAPQSGKSGIFSAAKWSDLDKKLGAALKSAAGKGGRVRVLTGLTTSPSTKRLIEEFLAPFGAGLHVEFEAITSDAEREASEIAYGTPSVAHYRFDRADAVVSLGADFLATWHSPVEYAKQWAMRRKLNSKNAAAATLSNLVVFEPGFSVTGANADQRYGVRSGDELLVALAIASELIVRKKVSRFAGDSALVAYLGTYTAESVATQVKGSWKADAIRSAADLLWSHRGRSLVVAGGASVESESAVALQLVVGLLNSALENDGVTVDGTGQARVGSALFPKFLKLVADMQHGNVDVLVMHRVNPIYSLPKSLGFDKALAQVGTVIAVSDRLDETAKLAGSILADHHSLENWGDVAPRPGVVSLQQPTIAPLGDTRSFEESLIALAAASQLSFSGLLPQVITKGAQATALGQTSLWYEYVKANWKDTFYGAYGKGKAFESFWEETLQKGVLESVVAPTARARDFRSGAVLSALQGAPSAAGTPTGLRFAMFENVAMGSGSSANNGWLQEMPDPITTATWDNYLMVAPKLATQQSLRQGDIVEVKFSGGGSLELPVLVQPGLHISSVVAALGYGRTDVGRVGDGNGQNLFPFQAISRSRRVLAGLPVELRKTGKMYELAITQGHHRTLNRPIVNDITLKEFKKNPATANHTDPHLRMDEVPTIFPQHEYKGYRWGMAIDLNACTGCGACVMACQAENNIPIVGRGRVRMSREMHWIRIDRYYSGSDEQPDVVFEPMLCQHCENAPCESVCPVLATVHDSEGLNSMIYNRCVGTRYCQNNCPYKVRRFNFFDHWKDYKEPMNLVFNPDVTVRSRGVMEKCTFCIQRIQGAKGKAKDKATTVHDGDIKTACQQTCPTDAIVFGDINDPKSAVSQMHADARAFRVLEVLNARPSISYLTKVRNKEGGEAHEHHS